MLAFGVPRVTVSELLRLRTLQLLDRHKREDHELGRALGLSKTEVSMILSGKRGIRAHHLDALMRFFGLSPKDFFDVDIDGLVREWGKQRDRRGRWRKLRRNRSGG